MGLYISWLLKSQMQLQNNFDPILCQFIGWSISRQVFVFISLITPILAIYLQDLNVQETYLGDVKEFFNKEQTKAK